MNNKNKHLPRFFACLAILALWLAAGAVSAQNAQRPIYVDIRPVGGIQHDSLNDDLIAAMVRDALSGVGRSTIIMGDQTPPSDAYLLRVLYVVHRQTRGSQIALAASASTQLLRREDNDHDGVVQTLSLYSGLQQILFQGSDEQDVSERVRDAFKRQLKARISAAFLNVPSS